MVTVIFPKIDWVGSADWSARVRLNRGLPNVRPSILGNRTGPNLTQADIVIFLFRRGSSVVSNCGTATRAMVRRGAAVVGALGFGSGLFAVFFPDVMYALWPRGGTLPTGCCRRGGYRPQGSALRSAAPPSRLPPFLPRASRCHGTWPTCPRAVDQQITGRWER